ncbi:adenylylsulfate kinase [Rhodococcus rhodochrous]|nr:adenylylsulfate kinase [Rhodococcus rhodochrous]
MNRPWLIVIGGLPATGKTTVARRLAARIAAAYLRIDTIEQALVDSGELPRPPRTAGYDAGYALARDQLALGLTTVAECVNPVKLTRDAWCAAAHRAGARVLEVELVCTDPAEHRRRAEQRAGDIAGLTLPTWQQIRGRHYEAWDRAHLTIDTAVAGPDDAVTAIRREAGLLDPDSAARRPVPGTQSG